jgi:hypothetical protein
MIWGKYGLVQEALSLDCRARFFFLLTSGLSFLGDIVAAMRPRPSMGKKVPDTQKRILLGEHKPLITNLIMICGILMFQHLGL